MIKKTMSWPFEFLAVRADATYLDMGLRRTRAPPKATHMQQRKKDLELQVAVRRSQKLLTRAHGHFPGEWRFDWPNFVVCKKCAC
jgi:hypothetical protein